MSVDGLIGEYCVVVTRSQGGKIPIKDILDQPLRTISFIIEKVAGNKPAYQTTHSHMWYAMECMAPTIFN